MINVVVSRYKKNTDWVESLKKYNTQIMIYDKETPTNIYNIPVNKGNEASVYLKYIIDNYNNLSDFTFLYMMKIIRGIIQVALKKDL